MQPPTSKHWIIAEKIKPEADQELAAYPPVIRQLLSNRGVTEGVQAIRYLEVRAEPIDPFLLSDMVPAVDRLNWALEHHEKIAVFGDFDVDGVTATVLMVEALQALGGQVEPYIPDRFDEGYGLNIDALTGLKERGIQLVVTVDCGIRSVHEAKHANEIGLDLIISDHHHVGAELPEAFAVIDPKRADDAYPDKNLAGVGVAFKIVQALIASRPAGGLAADHWLDLVALGTVADMVPLTGENRQLVRKGLHRLRLGQRLGITSLANAARINLLTLNTGNIGYGLAPRLNAAGRLESAIAAYSLLYSRDLAEAGWLAQKLDDQNTERQKQTREMVIQAEQQLLESEEEFMLFALDPDFNPGVVGLVASRLAERFFRPAVVGTWVDGAVRASCRSIAGFHITKALDQCADILVRHGGHEIAAGFTVREEYLGQLRERLTKIAWQELSGQDLRPGLFIDLELTLTDLQPQLLDYLEMLQPTGQGNPEPVFCSRNLKITQARAVGADKGTLKLTVTDGKIFFDAIAFRMGHLVETLPNKIDLAYQFETNVFNGRTTLQLQVKDLKASGTPD